MNKKVVLSIFIISAIMLIASSGGVAICDYGIEQVDDYVFIILGIIILISTILVCIFGFILLSIVAKKEKKDEYVYMMNYAKNNNNVISTIITAIDNGLKLSLPGQQNAYYYFMGVYHIDLVFQNRNINFVFYEDSIEWEMHISDKVFFDHIDVEPTISIDEIIKTIEKIAQLDCSNVSSKK